MGLKSEFIPPDAMCGREGVWSREQIEACTCRGTITHKQGVVTGGVGIIHNLKHCKLAKAKKAKI